MDTTNHLPNIPANYVIWNEKMRFQHLPAERDDLIDLVVRYPSVKEAMKHNYTRKFVDDLHYRLYGAIPRNWVVNIQGLIGTPTGIFKSSLGLAILKTLTPNFTPKLIHSRVAFTPYQLSELVRKQNHRQQIFMLDEYIHDLKFASVYQLQNIVEQCREIQLCFIFCGVPKETYTFSSYVLERLDESDDKLLPKKRVRYLIRKPDTDRFRGYIQWDIPPLNVDKEWTEIWNEYMKLKSLHQDKVRHGQITGFHHESAAKVIIKEINKYLTFNRYGDAKLDKGLLEMGIYTRFPDNTNQERRFIYLDVLKWYKVNQSKIKIN